MCALFDQIERKRLGFFVLVLLKDLDAVDDRADRTDQIMTDSRAQQRREIEGTDGNGIGNGGGHGNSAIARGRPSVSQRVQFGNRAVAVGVC